MLIIVCFSCKKQDESPVISKAILTTNNIINITQTTAISGGNVVSDGGSTILSRGICWSINNKPTINDNKTIDSIGTGNFISKITGLLPNTIYYVCAYATNSIGIQYGNLLSFTTLQATLPTITTNIAILVTETTAISGGDITSDGSTPIIARGVCYNTTPLPTINDNKTIDSIGSGKFKSNITGLTPNTTYYLRAYATNNIGIQYGNQITFKTNSIPVTGIILNLTSTEIIRTNTKQLIATIFPSNATNKNIKWSSSNSLVAIVNNGLVTGISSSFIGSITITVTTEDGLFTASCSVTVIPIKVTSIIIMKNVDSNRGVPNPFNILIGENYGVEVLVLPTNADNKTVVWSNSNSSIINITPYGSIYCPIIGLSIGNSEITVTTLDGSNISAKQIINVVPITEMISLNFTANGIINIGGNIYGDVYSVITNNNHSIDIILTKFEIIDSYTGQIKTSTTDISLLGILYASQTKNLGITLNNVYMPIFKWYFTYNENNYSVQHQFSK
jgi:uncharacterized protein YjdB